MGTDILIAKSDSDGYLNCGHIFDEDRICALYAYKIIKTNFLNRHPQCESNYMDMLVDLFQKIGVDLLASCHKYILEYEKRNFSSKKVKSLDVDYNDWRIFSWNHSHTIGISSSELFKILLPNITEMVLKNLNKNLDLENFDYMSEQVQLTKSFFELTETEAKLIVFFMVKSIWTPLEEMLGRLDGRGRAYLISALLDVEICEYTTLISSSSSLRKFGIINQKLKVSEDISDYIQGLTKEFIPNVITAEENAATFDISSFDVPALSKKIILELLKSKAPCKILLYGKAGSGKTEFAKTLITACGKEIAVPIFNKDNEDENKFNKCAMAEFISNKTGKVALIDECDNIISSNFGFLHRKNTDKGDINKRLDSMKGKSIWITNSIESIEESTLRRFTFSIEFDGLSKIQKINSLKTALNATTFSDKIDAEELFNRLDKYQLSTAGIALSVNSANTVVKDSSTEEFLDAAEAFAKAQSVLINGKSPKKISRYKPDCHFDADIINMDTSYDTLMKILSNYSKKQEEGVVNCPLNMIFAGVPGSGKTELAKHIAQKLGKKIILKNMSDMQSMYVGETEKNIAKAFAQAEREKAILVIDEADSLFIDRSTASRNWEISQTNEMLAQMENFRGIFICSTNILENIDTAAMRRFQKKITFGYLGKDAREKLFKSYFFDTIKGLSEETICELEKLNNLTAGDFKNVFQQIQFADTVYDERGILELLKRETEFKIDRSTNSNNRIGFCV